MLRQVGKTLSDQEREKRSMCKTWLSHILVYVEDLVLPERGKRTMCKTRLSHFRVYVADLVLHPNRR